MDGDATVRTQDSAWEKTSGPGRLQNMGAALRGIRCDAVPQDSPSNREIKCAYVDDCYALQRCGDDWDDILNSCLPNSQEVASHFAQGMSHWKIILLGQALSLALATVGSTSAILDGQCDLGAPTFQMAFVYLAIAARYIYLLFRGRRCEETPPNSAVHRTTPVLEEESERKREMSDEAHVEGHASCGRGAGYTLLGTDVPLVYPCHLHYVVAFLHVEGNFFTFSAYQYTSFKSIALLDSLATPAAMLSSRWLLKRCYGQMHLVGVCICILGSLLMLTSDVEESVDHSLMGDLLAIAGALLYGLNDTLAELVVKDSSLNEYLGMLGLFGSLISFIQVGIVESETLVKYFDGSSTCSGPSSFLLLTGFVASAYIFFVGMGHFLAVSEAALFNLSLLTGDIWALLFSIFEQKDIPTKLFFVSLIVTVAGVFVYEMAPSPIINRNAETVHSSGESFPRNEHVVGDLELVEEPMHGGGPSCVVSTRNMARCGCMV